MPTCSWSPLKPFVFASSMPLRTAPKVANVTLQPYVFARHYT